MSDHDDVPEFSNGFGAGPTGEVEPDATPATVDEVDVAALSGRAAMKADQAAREAPEDAGPPIEVRGKEFATVRELPAATVLDLGALDDPTIGQGERSSILRSVLVEIIHPSQRSEWRMFLRRTEPPIDMEELSGAIRAALEKIFGRPTK